MLPSHSNTALLDRMLLIRRFEEMLLRAFGRGELRGTTHTSIGQEAVAVSAAAQLRDGDVVFSNHRCHGHFLAYGGDPEALLLEILGDSAGISHGLGGSQHLQWRNFYSNGIQGGIAPVAAGMALAERAKGGMALCFLGDGTLGQGVVYESFNLAALWSLPILFVVENNGIAQTTPTTHALAGRLTDRPAAFGIDTSHCGTNHLPDLLEAFARAAAAVRSGRPHCLVVDTVRLGPHSKGDDTRSPAELEAMRERDPLRLARACFTSAEIEQADRKAGVELATLEERMRVRPERPAALPQTDRGPERPAGATAHPAWLDADKPPLVLEHLRDTLHSVMTAHPTMRMLGEDILDPYGGAFKVTRGLSTAFPGRVLGTPISEAAIVGIATGAALRGQPAVVELMFGDFAGLAFDQVLNHLAKFPDMYGRPLACPVVLRAPMGGYRGYGPTHSQSLEKFFAGIPGLRVVALSPAHDQRPIWEAMLGDGRPTFYVEHKTLYGARMLVPEGRETVPGNGAWLGEFTARSSDGPFPTLTLTPGGAPPPADLTIVTYGGMVPMALEASRALLVRHELIVEVAVVAQIAPLPDADLLDMADRTRAVLVVEEGTRRLGWGAEVLALLAEKGPRGLRLARCAAADALIPNCAAGEAAILPSVGGIITTALRVLDHA